MMLKMDWNEGRYPDIRSMCSLWCADSLKWSCEIHKCSYIWCALPLQRMRSRWRLGLSESWLGWRFTLKIKLDYYICIQVAKKKRYAGLPIGLRLKAGISFWTPRMNEHNGYSKRSSKTSRAGETGLYGFFWPKMLSIWTQRRYHLVFQ